MMRIKFEGEVLTPVYISGLDSRNIEKISRKVRSVFNILRKNIPEQLFNEVSKYEASVLKRMDYLRKFARNPNEFIKDFEGTPIIPGSSIKGAFASAIEDFKNWKVNDKEREIAFQNIGFRDAILEKDSLIKASITISPNISVKAEVLKIGVKFKLEMFYRKNNLLSLEEVIVFPALRSLQIVDLILQRKEQRYLPSSVLEYYNSYVEKFGRNFMQDDILKKFEFCENHGMIIRLGKYTGKLCKLTMDAYSKTYDQSLRTGRFIGRIAFNYLMGFVNLKMIDLEENER